MFGQGEPIDLDVKVDVAKALRFLGHRGHSLGDDMEASLEAACRICDSEIAPKGIYDVFEVAEVRKGSVSLVGTRLELPGRDISRRLDGCVAAACIAVTLGAASEMLLRRESAASGVHGLLVDACASSMAEVAAEGLNALVAENASAKLMECLPRFSPGYGDMPLDCQRDFIAAIGADKMLGIGTTASNLLVPRKSITAVIGLVRSND